MTTPDRGYAPFCIWCGYSLDGISAAKCPECGGSADRQLFDLEAKRRMQWVMTVWRLSAAVSGAGTVMVLAALFLEEALVGDYWLMLAVQGALTILAFVIVAWLRRNTASLGSRSIGTRVLVAAPSVLALGPAGFAVLPLAPLILPLIYGPYLVFRALTERRDRRRYVAARSCDEAAD